MTTPATQTPPPNPAVPAQVDDHDAAALAVEAALVAATASVLLVNIYGAVRLAKRSWLKQFGNLTDRQSGPSFRRAVQHLADSLPRTQPALASKIQTGIDGAHRMGVEQGYREAGRTPVTLQVAADSGDILAVVRHTEDRITRSAQALNYTFGGTWSTLEAQARQAQIAVNGLARDVATAFNTNLNKGIEEAADDMGAQLLWIAERDACATCLALSGEVVTPGISFPLSATFANKPTAWTPPDGLLLTPPRHPRCRCRVTPWFGTHGPGLSLPDALRREAQRSILAGTRRPSESEMVRLDAADRLLHRIATHSPRPYAWQVPKSVQERAARAVKRGHFPTP